MMIKAVKRMFNSDTMCRSYSDLNVGVTFFGTVYITWNCSDFIIVPSLWRNTTKTARAKIANLHDRESQVACHMQK